MSETISNNLSVGGNITTSSLTSTTANVDTLQASTINTTNLQGTISNLTIPTLTSTNITNSATITTPELFIGASNIGTSVKTLQDNNVVDRANIATLQTKTTNLNYNPTSLTTTINGDASIPSLVSNIKTTNTVNGNYLEIKSGYSTSSTITSGNSYIGTGNIGDLINVNNRVTVVKALTANEGAQLGSAVSVSRVRRNLNVDNAMRVGYNEFVDIGAGGWTNNSKLDVSGNINCTNLYFNNTDLSAFSVNTTNNLNTKAPSNNPTLTGVISLIADISANGKTISPTELSYLDGITSNAQSQIDSKANTNNPTFIGTTTAVNYGILFKEPSSDTFQDVFNNPPVIQGLSKGTGDGASYTAFSQALMSWNSTAFVDSCFKKVMAFIDHRTGNFFTKGTIQANVVNVDQNVNSTTMTTNTLTATTANITGNEYVTGDIYMASGYMSQGVNATNCAITNANLTNATIANYTAPAPCWIGGYVIMINGGGMQPIFCTIKNTVNYYPGFNVTFGYIGVTNSDYGYLVMPGYRLEVYRDPSFGRLYGIQTIGVPPGYDNTNGTVPKLFADNIRDVGSWKLFYKGNEVLITTMSTAT